MTTLAPPSTQLLDKFFGDEALALYTGRVVVTGGEAAHGRASGVVRSSDDALHAQLRLPVELGGPGGGSNPEQLFAAGYAACFHGVMSLLAARAGIELRDARVDASVTFARDPADGLFALSAALCAHLPGLDRALAAELVRHAERYCPYAKMFRKGIDHVVVLAPEPSPYSRVEVPPC